MGLLNGKTALITGAARGIGKAIALKFASEGADVAFTDLEINEAALQTVRELEAFGHKVKAYASNAADFEATQQVVAQVTADFGRIDILVNNAGITKDGLVMRMSEQQWDAVIAVNMKSAFNFLHAVVPVMARQRSGSIINMASIAGQTGNPGQVNYAASKAGLIAMAKSVAKEMGSRGIRANAIAPGYVITEMTEGLPQAVKDEFVKLIPLGRGATVEEIANTALYLGSDLSSYVSGQVIAVNGGMYC
ncbi:MAG: 3-oxoacyl-[Bacteroidales bacterium]|nr:3-oxoacyl-[acyl-carrier-protein] reductase [Bacteroidales bacterium]